MSTPRTVTVHTGDHGDVHMIEPFWCAGDHPAEGYREDIEHRSEDVVLTVPTPCCGEQKLTTLTLVQRPFSRTDTTAKATVEFAEDYHDVTSAQLAEFTDALVVLAVGPLHQFIERLQLLEGDQR